MALSFSKVHIKSSDGELSQTFNFKPGTTKTLFESQTIATIAGIFLAKRLYKYYLADENGSSNLKELAELNPFYAGFKNDTMAVVSGKTVNFFSFNLGTKLIYSYSIEGNLAVNLSMF